MMGRGTLASALSLVSRDGSKLSLPTMLTCDIPMTHHHVRVFIRGRFAASLLHSSPTFRAWASDIDDSSTSALG